MSGDLSLDYPAIRRHLTRHLAKGRTESRAFLVWFLENFYRLDEFASQDAVCDGPLDKGIDGLYADDNMERIDVFQVKLIHNMTKTLGDVPLKEFVGTLAQLRDGAAVEHLAETTANQELRSLIESSDVARKIGDGYTVRGVFVTNTLRDCNAVSYLKTQPNLVLYDAGELRRGYVPDKPPRPMTKPVTFDLFGYDVAEYKVDNARLVVAPLSAIELMNLDGLASTELFNWNVRQSLGRTKVNKAIAKSIGEQSEHKNFLLYHNGLTILCRRIERDRDRITVSGYSVVNGCQSLTSLYENRAKISDELRILTRLIELSPDSDLALKITHHSNNQNAISARDLQSNSVLQRRLQNEFEAQYGEEVFYRIKRGEETHLPAVIDNQDAARILLAFDLQQPWACHQTSRLFDALHSDIFARPGVNAHRILAFHDMYQVVDTRVSDLEHGLMASYRLTKFLLLYLLRRALDLDDLGRELCRAPDLFLHQPNGRQRLTQSVKRILADIIVDLNGELKEREEDGNPIDYKRELKSPTSVKRLARPVILLYQKWINRGRATSFAAEWRRAAHGSV